MKGFQLFLVCCSAIAVFVSCGGSSSGGSNDAFANAAKSPVQGQPLSLLQTEPSVAGTLSCPADDGTTGVVICHAGAGTDRQNEQTICVSQAAVQAHMTHHLDYLGVCGVPPTNPTPTPTASPDPSASPAPSATASPEPTATGTPASPTPSPTPSCPYCT